MPSPTTVAAASVAAIVLLIVPMLYLTVIGARDDRHSPAIVPDEDEGEE